jgi:hypothetical protein
VSLHDEPRRELRVDFSRIAYQVGPGEHRLFTVPAGFQFLVQGASVVVSRPGFRVALAGAEEGKGFPRGAPRKQKE